MQALSTEGSKGQKGIVSRLGARERKAAGATHEIALVAEPIRQPRASVWKRPPFLALVRIHSCSTPHNTQPVVSHASALRKAVFSGRFFRWGRGDVAWIVRLVS